MAKPETFPSIDPAPDTVPGDFTVNHEAEAPDGRFFDGAKAAGHLSLVHSSEVTEPAEADQVVGPHRPLKEGAKPLAPWGLGIFENNLYYGDERLYLNAYRNNHEEQRALKPKSIAALEILAVSDTGRLTFIELRDQLGMNNNDDLHDVLKELGSVFEWHHLPYFTNIVDFEAEERYITLHRTLPPED